MVKITLVILLMVTLVNFLMASLVALVVTLLHISFANTKIIVITQLVKFIDRNFGITFPRQEKNLVLILSRRFPLVLSLTTRHLLSVHLLLNTVYAMVVICTNHYGKPVMNHLVYLLFLFFLIKYFIT